MARRKWLKRTLWGFAVLVLAGFLLVVAAVWLWVLPRSSISVRNMASTPVEVVRLSYGGEELMEERVLKTEELDSFWFLLAWGKDNFLLDLQRPGQDEPTRYVFPAKHEDYGHCSFHIYVKEKDVEFLDCIFLH